MRIEVITGTGVKEHRGDPVTWPEGIYITTDGLPRSIVVCGGVAIYFSNGVMQESKPVVGVDGYVMAPSGAQVIITAS